MSARRRLIAILTFLAGLYFVLDFVVPPTLPGRDVTGIVADWRPGTLTVELPSGETATLPLTSSLQIFREGRDATGRVRRIAVRPRDARPGRIVDVRVRLLTVRELVADDPPSVRTVDGEIVTLGPGEAFYGPDDTGAPIRPDPGRTVSLELRGVRIRALDRGSLVLIRRDGRTEVEVGPGALVLRRPRGKPPAEIEVTDVRVGDTVTVGPSTGFVDNRDTAAQFNSVIVTLALGMGLISLGLVNGNKLLKRQGDWYTAIFFFVAVAFGVVTGVYKYAEPGTAERQFSDIVILRIITAVGSAIFSLLAFYMASAAYRAFRIRTFEAALMMVAALIVMLGQTPFGTYLTAWMGESLRDLWLPNVAAWLLRVPNTALYRALIFGVMLGAIATALRYWLSLERSVAMRED